MTIEPTGTIGRRRRLAEAIEHAAHLLPSQGPIGVFVHHNTLHAFEHMPFEKAVVKAAELFAAEPFMSEAWYRAELRAGRITLEDVDAQLFEQEERDDDMRARTSLLAGRVSRRGLRRLLLLRGILEADPASIAWMLGEDGRGRRFVPEVDPESRLAVITETTRWLSEQVSTDRATLEPFRDPLGGNEPQALVRRWLGVQPSVGGLRRALSEAPEACAVVSLWAAASRRVAEATKPRRTSIDGGPVRLRDLLLSETGRDADDLVLAVLAPVLAAFLDQGVAYWPMPERELGLYRVFRKLILQGPSIPVPLHAELRAVLRRQAEAGFDAEDALVESLEVMGVEPRAWDGALTKLLLALPGWAGIVRQLEQAPELAPHHCPPCRLVDFLAVRASLDRLAAARIARQELGYRGPLADLARRLADRPRRAGVDERRATAFALFQVAQHVGLSAPALLALTDRDVLRVIDEIDVFDDVERRRIWHLAYERRHRLDVLEALAAHWPRVEGSRTSAAERPSTPRLQVAFCIDEREESIRRHLEEEDPDIETFGAAGFYGVAISYRGLDDGAHASLCPVAVQPQHEIREVGADESAVLKRYVKRRKLLGSLMRGTFVGSRSLARGWLATFGLGLVSMLPLAVRVLFPRAVTRINRRLHAQFFPRPRTRLAARRDAEERGALGMFPGFTHEEMADRVGRVLEDIGLVERFAPIVAVIGHGSSSRNNPHESAHDCGACSGRRGGPNARLLALMANDRAVRSILAARGIVIPDETVLVGGYHDTCNDDVVLFDTDAVPSSHREHLEHLRDMLDRARTLSAHERCRRFENVPTTVEPQAALLHVEGRAEDLAEPRPEYGHATNAICVFGRRDLTRGLFLDRRAFLVSYDPTIDPDAEILGRLLAAMGPVGAGINLEYYFSFVDNERYGCGTKLPHNVTGLVGVMNGHMSDLRTGLPWQMVEIHEPVRLLVIVEATHETIAKVVERHPGVGGLVANGWIQLALVHPDTGAITIHDHGRFVSLRPSRRPLPTVERSIDWYRGRREHLPIAYVIGSKGEPRSAA